jgi:hypothetical protein
LRDNTGRKNQAVLIDVGEISKSPHRSSCGRATVRLVPINECEIGINRNVGELGVPFPLKRLSFPTHREGDALGLVGGQLLATCESNEVPGKVVQGTPELMKSLTKEKTLLVPGGRKGAPRSA